MRKLILYILYEKVNSIYLYEKVNSIYTAKFVILDLRKKLLALSKNLLKGSI